MKNLLLLLSLLIFSTPLALSAEVNKAVFAGGCFWCMEHPFDKLEGVISTTSGYIGGDSKNPTYKDVSRGITGHTEAVLIKFDPKKVSYKKLLDVFWRNIDPTDAQGQFVDRGLQYRPGVFYFTEKQKEEAENSKKQLSKQKIFKSEIVVEITKASTFYPAEDYHQDYYKKNPIRYKFYRFNSGRDQFLGKYWEK